jgi:hypothetical protein
VKSDDVLNCAEARDYPPDAARSSYQEWTNVQNTEVKMPATDAPESVNTPEEIVPKVDDTSPTAASTDTREPGEISSPEGSEVVTAEPDASDRSPGQEAPEIVPPAPPTVPEGDIPAP